MQLKIKVFLEIWKIRILLQGNNKIQNKQNPIFYLILNDLMLLYSPQRFRLMTSEARN